jgi:hypothetical protein
MEHLPDAGENATVEVTHTFGGVAVTDFAAAYQWFMRLFGRAADMFPHDGEAVWRLTPAASVYVVHDAERAGHSLLTLAVDDLDACASHPRKTDSPTASILTVARHCVFWLAMTTATRSRSSKIQRGAGVELACGWLTGCREARGLIDDFRGAGLSYEHVGRGGSMSSWNWTW